MEEKNEEARRVRRKVKKMGQSELEVTEGVLTLVEGQESGNT
jgi:hypothetical protein